MSRKVLVTGGTRGIGAALVDQLIARGDRVLATGRTFASVSSAAVRQPEAEWHILDLARTVDYVNWLQSTRVATFDLVILNAGVQVLRDFSVQPSACHEALSIDQELVVNLAAPIKLSRALFGFLAPEAVLVFVTSGLALAPKRSSPVYCASKAGLRSFTKSLRAPWSGHGFRVVEALPPLVDTDMTRGRGARKLSASAAAAQIIRGVDAGRDEINVGATRLLRALMRFSPALGERIMRDR